MAYKRVAVMEIWEIIRRWHAVYPEGLRDLAGCG